MRLGCVPYVNATPLVRSLVGDPSVEIVYRHPSQLPAMLDSGEADVVLASSFEAIRTPGRKVVDGVSIASLEKADSVRLFSKVPFDRIGRLALDSSSLTSNHLAQIVLGEAFGVRPQCAIAEPSLDTMLGDHNAAVLIGDKGMTTDAQGLHVLDLGSAWRELTGLPFVWALWIGREDLDPAWATTLRSAREWGSAHLEEYVEDVNARCGWGLDAVRQYLGSTMDYELTEAHWRGLTRFAEFLAAYGFVPEVRLPVRV
ncbi:MAG: chorismate dehydratase [Chthonomonas sp.]